MILLDTGPIVAFFDASDGYHRECVHLLKEIEEPLITSWPVITEAFYLLGFAWKAQNALWEFILRGGLAIAPLDPKIQARCRVLMEKYRDLPMDLADASLVAIAEAMGVRRVFTLDHKDFTVYRAQDRSQFKLLPRSRRPQSERE